MNPNCRCPPEVPQTIKNCEQSSSFSDWAPLNDADPKSFPWPIPWHHVSSKCSVWCRKSANDPKPVWWAYGKIYVIFDTDARVLYVAAHIFPVQVNVFAHLMLLMAVCVIGTIMNNSSSITRVATSECGFWNRLDVENLWTMHELEGAIIPTDNSAFCTFSTVAAVHKQENYTHNYIFVTIITGIPWKSKRHNRLKEIWANILLGFSHGSICKNWFKVYWWCTTSSYMHIGNTRKYLYIRLPDVPLNSVHDRLSYQQLGLWRLDFVWSIVTAI